MSLRTDVPVWAAALFGIHFSAYGWHRRLEAVTASRFVELGSKAALRRKLHKLGCQPELKKSGLQKAAAHTGTSVRSVT